MQILCPPKVVKLRCSNYRACGTMLWLSNIQSCIPGANPNVAKEPWERKLLCKLGDLFNFNQTEGANSLPHFRNFFLFFFTPAFLAYPFSHFVTHYATCCRRCWDNDMMPPATDGALILCRFGCASIFFQDQPISELCPEPEPRRYF